MSQVIITLPERLAAIARRHGITDLEAKLVDYLLKELALDPSEEAEVHLELAQRYLEKGRKLVDEDPVQASEKLYKAAEECVKAAALKLGPEDLLQRVRERGRWTVTDLERAVRYVSRKVGAEFRDLWDTANYLHVWGFHEAKLDSEAVRDRVGRVERMVQIAASLVAGEESTC